MKRVLCSVILTGFFVGATVLTSFAVSEHESHHPEGTQAAVTNSTMGMSNMTGSGMGSMMGSGMGSMMGSGMGSMMSSGKMGMMDHGPGHMFFIDRAKDLGLSEDQVNKLKAINLECRKDNIRNAAESKIASLELAELLSNEDWNLKDAEALVRKAQKLEGDIQVRQLKAISDARKVLTAEQLKKAGSSDNSDNLESLFE